jgi:hypothetical protein
MAVPGARSPNMRLSKKDFHHGAAILQICRSKSLALVSPISTNDSLYRVIPMENADSQVPDRYLYLKYLGSNRNEYRFNFTKTELDLFKVEIESSRSQFFIGLICGEESICLLGADEIEKLRLTPTENTVIVEIPVNGKMRASNSKLNRPPILIQHSDFPKRILKL